MGQRLVITIEKEGEPLANAYYHWSGYTGSSVELTNEVLGWLDDADKEYSDVQKAVFALYMTGARFAPDECAFMFDEGFMKEDFSFVFDGTPANRNDGLLCVSQSGMENNLDWAESRVDIDIDTLEVYFEAIGILSDEEYKSYSEEYNLKPIDDLPVFNFDWEYTDEDNSWRCLELNSDLWDKFYMAIKRLLRKNQYTAKSPDGKIIYELIE